MWMKKHVALLKVSQASSACPSGRGSIRMKSWNTEDSGLKKKTANCVKRVILMCCKYCNSNMDDNKIRD
jgi:hypothetical protein